MKIGFWDRLALVAGALFVFGGATWVSISWHDRRAEAFGSGYNSCIARMQETKLTHEMCEDNWIKSYDPVGWQEWWQAVAMLAVATVPIYVLIWLAGATMRWIQRGRDQSE